MRIAQHFRGLLHTTQLGVRLMRTAGFTRTCLTLLGAALGALLLLTAFSAANALDAQHERDLQRQPIRGESGLHAAEEYPVGGVKLIYLSGEGTPPPGVPHVPETDEAYVSPALQQELAELDIKYSQFSDKELHTISLSGLSSPKQRLAYIGATEEDLPDDSFTIASWGVANDDAAWNQKSSVGPALIAFITLPAILLLATTTRLASAVRVRRMAALRLLGVSRFRTRLIAATEAGTIATLGALLAIPGTWIIGHLTEGIDVLGYSWFASDFVPQLPQVAIVVLAVPVLTVATTVVSLWNISRNLLQHRRHGRESEPSLLRLIPLTVGTVLLAVEIIGLRQKEVTTSADTALFLAGTFLVGIGILYALPVLVRRVSRLLARRSRRPSIVLAARRAQHEPTVITRLVAAVVLILFIATGAQAVIAAFENTPQHRTAHQAATDGPALMFPSTTEDGEEVELSAADREALGDISGVLDITTIQSLERAATSSDANDPGWMPAQALIATCEELHQLGSIQGACQNGEAQMLHDFYELPDEITFGPAHADGVATHTVTVNPVDPVSQFDSTAISHADVLIPPDTPGLPPPEEQTTRWLLHVEPDAERWNSIATAASNAVPGIELIGPDVTELERVANIRTGIWGGTAFAAMIALFTLLVTSVDHAFTRRHEAMSQRAMGISTRTIRASQSLQTLIPLGLGLPLAGAFGVLAGAGYMALDLENNVSFHWTAVFTTFGIAAIAAGLLALVSWPTVSNRVSPDGLRRE